MTRAAWRQFEGQTIENAYHLKQLLGVGGFGAVFAADHMIEGELVRRVAVKLISSEPEEMKRQLGELKAATSLHHPHLLGCFHAGSTTMGPEKLLYLVMEVADESLQTRMAGGPLSLPEVASLSAQLASGLAYLHERKLVHRDVKPGNLLRVGSAWKLADFGTIRTMAQDVSHTGRVTGTLIYMPPESFDNKVSTAWDIWSFGVLLSQLITGQAPFAGETDHQIMFAIARGVPNLPAAIQEPFGEVIRGCLIKEPEARWTVQQVIQGLAGEARPEAPRTAPLPQPAVPPRTVEIERSPTFVEGRGQRHQTIAEVNVPSGAGTQPPPPAPAPPKSGSPLLKWALLGGGAAAAAALAWAFWPASADPQLADSLLSEFFPRLPK
jgi:serine/threonine protein kinase